MKYTKAEIKKLIVDSDYKNKNVVIWWQISASQQWVSIYDRQCKKFFVDYSKDMLTLAELSDIIFKLSLLELKGEGFKFKILEVKNPLEAKIKKSTSENPIKLKYVLGLVRHHFENNEPRFKECARKIAKTLDDNNLSEQADFVLAQLGEVNTFSPQGESNE